MSRNVHRKTASGNLQANRLLDRVLVSKQASEHIGTQVGIYQGAVMAKVDINDRDTMHGEIAGESDHMMVVADLPIDTAGRSTNKVKLWDFHTVTRSMLGLDENGVMSVEKEARMNQKA